MQTTFDETILSINAIREAIVRSQFPGAYAERDNSSADPSERWLIIAPSEMIRDEVIGAGPTRSSAWQDAMAYPDNGIA